MTSIASRTALLKAVLQESPEADAVIAHVMGGMEPTEQPPAELVTKVALANQSSPSHPLSIKFPHISHLKRNHTAFGQFLPRFCQDFGFPHSAPILALLACGSRITSFARTVGCQKYSKVQKVFAQVCAKRLKSASKFHAAL
jgi:hypothetical protein